jgi:hypothetical protein
MRTLAKWGASLVRDAPFTSVRGQDGKVCSFFTSNYGRGSFERFEAGVEASFIHQRRGTRILGSWHSPSPFIMRLAALPSPRTRPFSCCAPILCRVAFLYRTGELRDLYIRNPHPW